MWRKRVPNIPKELLILRQLKPYHVYEEYDTPYRAVYSVGDRWRVQLYSRVQRRCVHVGTFTHELDAARVATAALWRYHPELKPAGVDKYLEDLYDAD